MKSYLDHSKNPTKPGPRVDLRKILRTRLATIIDAHGGKQEAAALIKAIHHAGGTPLHPALRKAADATAPADAAPAAPGITGQGEVLGGGFFMALAQQIAPVRQQGAQTLEDGSPLPQSVIDRLDSDSAVQSIRDVFRAGAGRSVQYGYLLS